MVPLWLIALVAVGAVAAIAKSSGSSNASAPPSPPPPGTKTNVPPPKADEAPVYQILTREEKLALVKTLPTRFVTGDKTDALTETLHLEKMGGLGDAAALPVLLRANMIGGHAVLVALDSATEGVSGGMKLLVPLEGGVWEKYAKKGSAWTLFLAPGEAKGLATEAGLDASALDAILASAPGGGGSGGLPQLPNLKPMGMLPSKSNDAAIGDAMNSASGTSTSHAGDGSGSGGALLFPSEDLASTTILSLPDTDRRVPLNPPSSALHPLHATMRDFYYQVTSGTAAPQSLAFMKKCLATGAQYLYEEGYTYASEQALKASM